MIYLLVQYLKELIATLTNQDDEDIASFYVREWKRYIAAGAHFQKIFAYLDSHFIQKKLDRDNKERFRVYQTFLVEWRIAFFPVLGDRIIMSALRLLGQQRRCKDHEISHFKTICDSILILWDPELRSSIFDLPPSVFTDEFARSMVDNLNLDMICSFGQLYGDRGGALQEASYGGQESMVQIFLEQGAEITAQEVDYSNALQAVSYRGYEKVVQMLIDAGADVNAEGLLYTNGLQAASAGGHKKVVQMLLDAGANISTKEGCDSALKAASEHGYDWWCRYCLMQEPM